MPEKRVSKVVYHTDSSDTTGTVWMDVTQKTVNATNLLSGETALKNDGTDIVGTLDPGGDYPIFTVDYNPQTENSTITCNKTFSECYTDATKETPVIIAILNFMVDNTLQFSKSMLLASISTGSQLTYMLNLNQVVPDYTIVYNSNGTITESGASDIFQDLTISGSGRYPAPSNIGFIAYHTVTVPSGSATTPATTVTANPSISVSSGGLITATASATKSVTPTVSAGYVGSGTAGTITVSGSNTQQLTTQAAKTVSPTESEQTAVASGVYTTGVVKVGAISSTYVGSGIAQKSSTDLTASGATVTAPAGYYSAAASKSVATGTAGTPTATKGTVSNHSVAVTPSVTNSAGYISGGTKTGTAVTVSASELVSGNKEITANGTGIDVANYSTVSVTVSGNGGSAISVVDTLDTNGGTIRTITAVDISSDTVTAAHLESGYTAHDAAGNAITGTYSAPSATQHVIHFDFSDNSDTDINVYYDDSLIGTMITAYTPTTYNNKTVTYASLDNTVWYEPTAIPLNTQLIDYTKCTYNKALNSSGAEIAQDWYYVSDFTPVETTMNFSYRAGYWTYIGFYNESKTALATVAVYNHGTQDPNDSNTGYGNITGSNLPAGTKYIRISGTSDDSNHMSLIRTA